MHARGTTELAGLSVIIPVGPGEIAWKALLGDLAPLAEGNEVILVEGHGEGLALTDANPYTRARWIRAPLGRAHQLNAGLGAARNRLVWLLHADTRLIPGCLDRLANNLPEVDELAYFDLRFNDGPALMALNTAGTWLRSRIGRMPFGDQGFVAHKRSLQRLGGFDPDVGRGEDHALVWRARRSGMRLKPLGPGLSTSARRYVEHGWWRTTRTHLGQTAKQAWRFSREPRT